ncbi:Unannotated [Lentimonas sp. CC19]|nr:Unannotated [Lentimonas sp. CC4]CAA6686738.1 Unannotated [Lentimonas sp. CC6]CAA6692878.1 Unannotated [Lentimonas sp. CC10]CAA6695570.1 Unannotated [Lentimonas sp. CC19]CAA7069901.1 Unannotated [Lentimonas sp. CC11]CAA7168157.1 Unannotated [Lentimonas sp. CC21]CAA7181695.1 Unannotated [Lentimonas sp. CC8]
MILFAISMNCICYVLQLLTANYINNQVCVISIKVIDGR